MKPSTTRSITRLALMATLVPLLAFGPQERVASTRWAFIVGISDYIHLEAGEGGDLVGPEQDVPRMRDVLVQRHGFPAENVRTLVNHDATKAAIEEGITGWLVQNARPGDVAFIYYSGHGSQMWDEDGDEDDGLIKHTFDRVALGCGKVIDERQ